MKPAQNHISDLCGNRRCLNWKVRGTETFGQISRLGKIILAPGQTSEHTG
jgi:hypothetical protein